MKTSFISSRSKLTALIVLLVLAFLSTPGRKSRVRAFTTAQCTFVSGLGSDSDPCAAMNQTGSFPAGDLEVQVAFQVKHMTRKWPRNRGNRFCALHLPKESPRSLGWPGLS